MRIVLACRLPFITFPTRQLPLTMLTPTALLLARLFAQFPLILADSLAAATPSQLAVGRSIKDTCYNIPTVHCIRLRDPLTWRGDFSYTKGSSNDGEIEDGGRIILYTEPTVGIYRESVAPAKGKCWASIPFILTRRRGISIS